MDSLKSNYKFRISGSEQSERLQIILLKMGYKWADGFNGVVNTDKPFLYVSTVAKDITYGSGEDFYLSHGYCEKDPEAFIAEHGPQQPEQQSAGEFSGGDVNYYLLKIDSPKRLSPYECEAEDIIEALNMTFAEGNVFKALWRSCAMRVRGHGKAGQDEHGVYDGDKIAYYGERVKVQRRRKAADGNAN